MAIVRYLLAILVLVLQDDPAVKTRRLIDRLRSENIAEREEATKGLKELGEAAKPELEKAAKDADAEFASRARYLLRRLELRATLSSNLLKAVPDAADRLADGAGSAWTEVFQQATAYDERGMNRRFEFITRNDLEILAGPAILGARTSAEKRSTISTVAIWRLRSGLPAAEQMLSDSDPMVGLQAFQVLRMAGKERAPQVANLLKDPQVVLRASAIGQLAAWNAKEYLKDIREALKGGEPWVRRAAMWAIAMMEGAAAAGELVDLLHGDLRAEASQLLAVIGARPYSDRIAELLKDQDSGVRGKAASALGVLGDRRFLKSVLPLLEDESEQVRGYAALAVSQLGEAADGKRLVAILQDKSSWVRMFGLMALRQFDDPGYIKEIIPLLKDSNPTVQREAVTALRSLGAVIPGEILPLVEKGSEPSGFEVSLSAARALGEMAFSLSEKEQEPLVAGLKALENHAAETVRHAASIALVRMGRKDRNAQWELVNRFVSTNLASSHLSAMYLAEAVALANEERLRRPAELKEKIESMDGLKRALQTVGLELDLGSAAWRVSNIRIREGRKLTWHQVLERSSVSLPFVLDGDTIRCMEPEAALEFWLKRLSDSDK